MPRPNRFARTFLYVNALVLFILLLVLHTNVREDILNELDVESRYRLAGGAALNAELPNDTKYILLWTGFKAPLSYMGAGRQGFLDAKCPVANCFVTDDRDLLDDYTEFDAVIFAGPNVVGMGPQDLPKRRSPHQKYIFGTFESSDNYPVCSKVFEGFFNWTWTYKLDSDARWGYIVVRDSKGEVIGPEVEMDWPEELTEIEGNLKKKLGSKSKAAAWFVSNCRSRSGREKFVAEVQQHLKTYGLSVDVFGACGPHKCSRSTMEKCLEMVERDYYFYFSFENSFAEDYVTEKLLHALQHDTVPVVYGGANYTRFMPDGIYLDGRALGAEELAITMYELINNKERYYKFFRYKNRYSFYRRWESVDTNDYCKICEMLHDEELVHLTTVYEHFKDWWNPPNRC